MKSELLFPLNIYGRYYLSRVIFMGSAGLPLGGSSSSGSGGGGGGTRAGGRRWNVLFKWFYSIPLPFLCQLFPTSLSSGLFLYFSTVNGRIAFFLLFYSSLFSLFPSSFPHVVMFYFLRRPRPLIQLLTFSALPIFFFPSSQPSKAFTLGLPLSFSLSIYRYILFTVLFFFYSPPLSHTIQSPTF